MVSALQAAREAARERVSIRPKGIDFVRAAIAQALAETPKEAAQIAANRWGEKSRAAQITKTAVGAASTATGTGEGGKWVNDAAAAEFYDVVRSQAVIGRVPFRQVPFHARTLSMDEGPVVRWRDEGAAYASGLLKVTSVTGLEPFDLGALMVVTKELLDSSSAETIIRDQLSRALAAELDRTLLDPANTGTAGIKPASITSGSAVMDSPSEALFDWGDTFTGDPALAWLVVSVAGCSPRFCSETGHRRQRRNVGRF